MKNAIVALSLALTLIPVAAFADDQSPAGAPTQAQRQAIFQTMETYHQKAEQLHQQFRAQLLGSISPIHRTAVANLIGQLAISTNPNERTAASQIDALLSPGERQQIINAHNNFRAQSKTLHEQMRSALKNEMPDHPMGPMGSHPDMQMMGKMHEQESQQPDAGRIILHVLGNLGGDEHHLMMFGGGPPPPHH